MTPRAPAAAGRAAARRRRDPGQRRARVHEAVHGARRPRRSTTRPRPRRGSARSPPDDHAGADDGDPRQGAGAPWARAGAARPPRRGARRRRRRVGERRASARRALPSCSPEAHTRRRRRVHRRGLLSSDCRRRPRCSAIRPTPRPRATPPTGSSAGPAAPAGRAADRSAPTARRRVPAAGGPERERWRERACGSSTRSAAQARRDRQGALRLPGRRLATGCARPASARRRQLRHAAA